MFIYNKTIKVYLKGAKYIIKIKYQAKFYINHWKNFKH